MTISYQIVYNAYRNISMLPDERANREITYWENDLASVYDAFKRASEAGQTGDQLDTVFQVFKERVTALKISQLHAMGRCASVMVTGGGGFNNARNAKANEGLSAKRQMPLWKDGRRQKRGA
jgi:Zn-dependent M32 family carboxypeptidase